MLIEKGRWNCLVVILEGKKGGIGRRLVPLGSVQQNPVVLCQNQYSVGGAAEHDSRGDVIELGINGKGNRVFGDNERSVGLNIYVNVEQLNGAVKQACF